MTDWEMVIESFPGRPAQLSPREGSAAGSEQAAGPKRWFTTTLSQVIGVARALHATWITARRGRIDRAEHARARCSAAPARNDYGGTASFDERHDQDPDLRAVQRPDAVALQHEGAEPALRSHQPADRRCRLGPRWRSAVEQLAGADLPDQVEDRHRDAEATSSSTRSDSPPPATPTSRAPSTTSSGGRELKGQLADAGRAREDRRQQLALSRTCAATCCGCRIGSKSPTRRSGLYGGTAEFDYRILSLDQKSGPKRAVWDVEVPRRRSRAAHRLPADRGDPARRSRDRAQPSGMAAGRMGAAARRRRGRSRCRRRA